MLQPRVPPLMPCLAAAVLPPPVSMGYPCPASPLPPFTPRQVTVIGDVTPEAVLETVSKVRGGGGGLACGQGRRWYE